MEERTLLNEYTLGDMCARFQKDAQGHVGLILFPAGRAFAEKTRKAAAIDSMIQFKLAGDMYEGCYAPGNTLRNSESVMRMKYQKQKINENNGKKVIVTEFADDRGYQIHHILSWQAGATWLEIGCEFINAGEDIATLEMMESFSLEMISPYLSGDGHGELNVHRLRSRWSQEGMHEILPLEKLQLETSWNMDSVRCERFGQAGSLPVNKFFPWLFLEDKKNHVFWGAQLSEPASWQMEIFRKDENLAISGGVADMEFGHWKKDIKPGQRFAARKAVITVCQKESIDIASARITSAQIAAADRAPETEKNLPIIFNEYCTTWGNPSHENISEIVDAIKGKGFTYFVIDCGWYKAKGIPWDISMGDYEVSTDLFPEGLEKTVQMIKNAGMKPGIWFEIETVGHAARNFHNIDHLLKKDGYPLTTSRRRFWNMADPWVQDYLSKRVIGTLKECGFEYIKVDYNDTIGIGCDGSESYGEGLQKNMIASQEFFRKIRSEVPDIVIENCASGGHRLEPGYMGLSSMASFSDAHECVEIPIIAADVHRAVLPRQSQIWAVIRSDDSLKRIAYSLISTFLGRMCISGDVTRLNTEQWLLIERGMKFYKSIASIIKNGQTYRYGEPVKAIRYPEGWQGVLRVAADGNSAFALLHVFDGELPEIIEIQLPEEFEIREMYSEKLKTVDKKRIKIEKNMLMFSPKEKFSAIAIHLSK